MPKTRELDIAERTLICVWKSPPISMPSTTISEKTGIPRSTIDSVYAKACNRGFEPNAHIFSIKDEHVKNNWPLDQWKRVVFTDETSVILNHKRGGTRLWRRSDEAYEKACTRERWGGYSEFMFWGAIQYDHKGPCHIWRPETAQEKKEATKDIKAMNTTREPELRAEWKLNTAMKRVGIRNKRGPKPTWKFNAEQGALTRSVKSKGGIDWYRYQKHIILPKIIPFVQKLQREFGIDAIVQEDNTPSHAHHYQTVVYDLASVTRLLWPGNSPDLNAIEKAWPWLKRTTTKKVAPKNRKDAEKAWLAAWKTLPQDSIRRWIEAIPVHIQAIIEAEGDNNYREGLSGARRRQQHTQKRQQELQEEQYEDCSSSDSEDVAQLYEDFDDLVE
ncbi:hypothetical protein K402DRAFT_342121 [Aulographum hederae CBS 113979]|uniref:Tc1-like transposase DDE domain-containing protein n=1 Tax=Aulographum hederae CBS 113979 TaxID=1176131 RepID=A0A6G1GKU5_9PEZI|nr:hypothetical protein K402DRAFT_342121 [Aulographum hederae CBS 113979]